MTKKLEIYMTSTFSEEYSLEEIHAFSTEATNCFNDHQCDMIIFEKSSAKGHQIRLAGYSFTDGNLDEETIVHESEEPIKRKFWFKVDDYGNKYVGTFIFPEEY